jgi:hypothetical protein
MTSPQRGSSVDWLHSIRSRIMLGFMLVLLLVAVVAGAVARRRAGQRGIPQRCEKRGPRGPGQRRSRAA